MKEVYIVKMFDGESSYILGVFLSKDKADEYANAYEKSKKNFMDMHTTHVMYLGMK